MKSCSASCCVSMLDTVSVDEKIRDEVARPWHDGITIEIRYAVHGEELIVDEKVAAGRAGIARQNEPRGIRDDFGPSALLQVNARNHLQRRRRNHRARPQAV